ncbi:MAG: hypothetical protein ABDI19_06835 [Armatimonadota bacterium]
MAAKTADEIYATCVKDLPIEERIRLIERISRELAIELKAGSKPSERDWRELAGRLPYPAIGEDAQEWVSRTRREADERREKQWEHLLEP